MEKLFAVTMCVDEFGDSYGVRDFYYCVGVFDTKEKAEIAGKEACKGKAAAYTVSEVEKGKRYDDMCVGCTIYYE